MGVWFITPIVLWYRMRLVGPLGRGGGLAITGGRASKGVVG
jgi:hypothetical protein